MLVMTRKVDEGIWIGDDIRVLVVCIRPGVVRLGIEAPRAVKVLRDELKDREHERGRDGRSDRNRLD